MVDLVPLKIPWHTPPHGAIPVREKEYERYFLDAYLYKFKLNIYLKIRFSVLLFSQDLEWPFSKISQDSDPTSGTLTIGMGAE